LRRLTLGLTQDDVAELSGLSREQIARLEQGRCTPTRRTVRDLAQALVCTPASIFPLNEDDGPAASGTAAKKGSADAPSPAG
jgi:transcriptional regulator with XRE-family HTH domain